MRYLTLLYADETGAPVYGTPEFDADLAGYAAFDEVAGAAIVAGEAMEANDACRTVRHDGGVVRVTAGPYAETTEGLGGWFVLETADLDEALELVRHIPAVAQGGVELRPLAEWVDNSGERSVAAGSRRVLATIHGTEVVAVETPGSPEWDAGAAERGAFAATAGDALLAAGALHPTSAATTVRVRDGELLVTDGPYAEALEVVGGFYVLTGTDAEVAALAARVPVPAEGAVELRPIMELDG